MFRMIHALVLITFLIALIVPAPTMAAPAAQTPAPGNPDAARVLAGLTPEERVGQLFIVTFNGAAVDETTPIYELVTQYYIGGVVLSAANDNFAEVDKFAGSSIWLEGWRSSRHLSIVLNHDAR